MFSCCCAEVLQYVEYSDLHQETRSLHIIATTRQWSNMPCHQHRVNRTTCMWLLFCYDSMCGRVKFSNWEYIFVMPTLLNCSKLLLLLLFKISTCLCRELRKNCLCAFSNFNFVVFSFVLFFGNLLKVFYLLFYFFYVLILLLFILFESQKYSFMFYILATQHTSCVMDKQPI